MTQILPHETRRHRELRDAIRASLGPWRRFVIAVDGVDGSGKTHLARYLSWQLQISLVEADLYLIPKAGTVSHRINDLRAVVEHRLNRNWPVIIEGVCILRLLKDLGIETDYLVWVHHVGHDGSHGLEAALDAYSMSFMLRDKADFVFKWEDTSF